MSSPAGRSANWIVARISEDNLLSVVVTGSIILALVLTAGCLVLDNRPTAFGIAAGAGIAILNFVWQRSVMQRVLGLQPNRPAAYATLRYLLRLGLTAILLYYILTSGLFSVTGLLVGLSVVVVLILFCTAYFAIQHKGD